MRYLFLHIIGVLSLLFPFSLSAQDNGSKQPWISCPGPRAIPLNLDSVKTLIGYPLNAIEAGIQGDVVLGVLAGEDGSYVKHIVVNQVHPILLKEVLKQIHTLRFSPAIQGDSAIQSWVSVTFPFQLPSGIQPKPEEPAPNVCYFIEKRGEVLNLDSVMTLIGYPEMAKEAGIEGDVVLRIQVDENGRYVKHIVSKQVHPVLLKAVENNVKYLRFSPSYQGNSPVKLWLYVPFRFRI
ncbi:MAG: energy transducer TonB [Bacteroidia bacterium]|nr:energy transducer TonB [Bacteroidia bacterium]